MAEEQIINKLRFLRVGYKAPKTSKLKGIVSTESLFGTKAQSIFNYNTRYCKEKEDNEYNYDSLFTYETRYSDKKNYTITKHGPLDTKEKIEQFRKMGSETLSNKGDVLYETIISIKDTEIAKKYNMLGSKGFGEVANKIMDRWLKKCGFDPENIEWFLDYHPDNRSSIEPHPHMHLCFFEKKQTRDRCKLPLSRLNDFKQMFASKMAERDIDTKSVIKKYLSEADSEKQLFKEALEKCNISKVKSVRDLWKVLPRTGRLQYDSTNMIGFRPAVDRVVDNLLKTEEFKQPYEKYISKLKEYDNMINKISGNEGQNVTSFKEITEDKKLRKEVAQFILQKKKDYDSEIKYSNFSRDKHGIKLGVGPLTKKLGTRKNYSTKAEHHVHKFINGALMSRQREIEEEIEKFLKASQPDYQNY